MGINGKSFHFQATKEFECYSVKAIQFDRCEACLKLENATSDGRRRARLAAKPMLFLPPQIDDGNDGKDFV
jgi:hypothetical protein